TIAALLS
nr:Chain A, THR-ILE-ALA-ALA-LEU-LEU-SER [Homo sapiens]6C4O_B Chain B, THR-ILE-ALA-ALA-LEU-LEU-SER [Homo sapiens]